LVTDEPLSKALKLNTNTEEKLALVSAAVGNAHGRFLPCQVMLESMVPGALGPGLDERDELQDEGVQMIGKVMEKLLRDCTADLERKAAIVQDPDGTKGIMKGSTVEAQAAVEAAVKDETEKDAGFKAARADLNAARKALTDAKSAQKKAEQELSALIKEKEAYEDAYNMHFKPLRDGQYKTLTEAKHHVQALIPLFKMFEYEDSLIAGFPPAAERYPDDRRHFDNLTMNAAEKGFVSFRQKLEDAIAAAEPLIHDAIAAVAAAEDEVKVCKEKEYEAGLALGRSKFALAVVQLKLADATKELEEFPANPKQAETMKTASASALTNFRDGPYEAYVYLRDRVAALAPYL